MTEFNIVDSARSNLQNQNITSPLLSSHGRTIKTKQTRAESKQKNLQRVLTSPTATFYIVN